jgi:predicted SnoaL-like aldol condensation-catalyzing enzyme
MSAVFASFGERNQSFSSAHVARSTAPSPRPAGRLTTLGFFRIEDGVLAEHWESLDWVRAYQSFGL